MAAAPAAAAEGMHKVVLPHFKRLVNALVDQKVFVFEVSMLEQPMPQRRKLVSTKGHKLSSGLVNGRIQTLWRLMHGDDKRCPDFARRLQLRLDEAKAEFEANAPPPQTPPSPPLINSEPNNMIYYQFYPMAHPDSPLQFDPINLHDEAYYELQDGDEDDSGVYQMRNFNTKYVFDRGVHRVGSTDKVMSCFATYSCLMNSLLVLGRHGEAEFIKRFAATSAPESFKAFLRRAAAAPEHLTNATMAHAMAAVYDADGEGQELPGYPYPVHHRFARTALRLLKAASGITVNGCRQCAGWWLTRATYLDYDELVLHQPLPRLPIKNTAKCPRCQQPMATNQRPSRTGFVAVKKPAKSLYKLTAALTTKHYKRTLRVCGGEFRCRAANFKYAISQDHDMFVALIIPVERNAGSEIQVVSPLYPYDALPKAKVDEIPAGYIDSLMYVRAA